MSGHSKWSTIKRQKGLADARRSAVFGKLARQITMAARNSPNPDMNVKLRLAIDRARAANMPNQNIERAIQAGSGDAKAQTVKEIAYEGFGPGGVAVIVQALTDNPNRTGAEIRNIFSKFEGSLGSMNSVTWMFKLAGLIRIPLVGLPIERDALELSLIDVGADDVRSEQNELVIQTPPEQLAKVRDWLRSKNIPPSAADLEYVPNQTVEVAGPTVKKLYEFLEALDQHDDVTAVFSNDA